MKSAVAHLKQLLDLGCVWTQAVQDTALAFACCPLALCEEYAVKYP